MEEFYTFTNLEEFMDLVEKGFFLEKNQYAGEWYGTPLHLVRACVDNGKIAVVEVDSNGFRQIMDSPYTKNLRILSVFVVADADTIISRLIDRNTENLEKILLRVTSSLAECEQIDQYDMILPNYSINTSVAHIEKALCEGVNPQSTFDAEGYKKRMKEIIELLIE